jgi:hypothetical protein
LIGNSHMYAGDQCDHFLYIGTGRTETVL